MTEAKDTVTSACKLCSSATNQADISFKAGVKEVVEWITEHWISRSFHEDGTYELLVEEWEHQLKTWGIE